MFKFWLAWRYLFSGKKSSNLTTSLGVLGLAIGVACLFVSMSVMSGYETTLKQNIIDVSGHLLVVKRQALGSDREQIEEDLATQIKEPFVTAPYLWLEGLMAHKGSLSGIFLEGAKVDEMGKVLNLKHRVVSGKLNLETDDSGVAQAVVGQGIARRYKLKVGDRFKVVIPFQNSFSAKQLKRKVLKLKIAGIVELGRHEYSQRYILVDMDVAKKMLEDPNRVTGFRVKLSSAERADEYKKNINTNLGTPYWARSWRDHERNIFQAVQLEKYVVFFVIFIMVIVASFNIASTLYVAVFRKISDIATLKAMGLKRNSLLLIFSLQGVFIGLVGSICGLLLGLILAGLFVLMQQFFPLLPSETYRITMIHLDFRWTDILMVVSSSVLICFIATLAPALRGARLNPVEGLRYE